jgi:hypothetical protein
MGWIVGGGSDATITPGIRLPIRFRSISWGAPVVYLSSGQTVEVNYAANIERGQFGARLKPIVWLMGIGAQHGYSQEVSNSGAGTLSVQAPDNGWYAVTIGTKSSLSKEELEARPMFGPRVNARLNYRVRWRVLG